MTEIAFSAMHLIIDSKSPDVNNLEIVFNDLEDTYEQDNTHYLIKKKRINENSFWLYAKYGKSLPYSETVYNTDTQEEDKNPRNKNQVEPDKQVFALYLSNKRTLFLSSSKKKKFLESYLKSKLEKDVTIKAFFKSADEFLEKMKTIDKVKFVAKTDLFNIDGDIMKIFPAPKDLYGLGMPEKFSLEADFCHAKTTKDFTNIFKKMVGWKNAAQADSLLCIGKDDEGFEAIFNIDSFIQKVVVPEKKDPQGLYDPESVLNTLISKLEEYK